MRFPGIINNGQTYVLLKVGNKLFSFSLISFLKIGNDLKRLHPIGKWYGNTFKVVAFVFVNLLDHRESSFSISLHLLTVALVGSFVNNGSDLEEVHLLEFFLSNRRTHGDIPDQFKFTVLEVVREFISFCNSFRSIIDHVRNISSQASSE